MERSTRTGAAVPTIFVGVARFEVHVPEARSLKEKRRHTLSLVQRLKARHQVLVIEAGGQDLHQRATIAVCAMSSSEADLAGRLDRVHATVDETWSGHVLSWESEIIELEG
jgi:uncharacterized protein